MTRASSLLLPIALLLAASCRRPSGAARDVPTTPPARDAAVREEPPSPAPRWCFEPMERADLRAIDDEGHLWTLRGDALSRDGDAQPTRLAGELPCPSPGTWAMEFRTGGAASALVDGRFYVSA